MRTYLTNNWARDVTLRKASLPLHFIFANEILAICKQFSCHCYGVLPGQVQWARANHKDQRPECFLLLHHL